MKSEIKISTEPIDIQSCINWVMSPESGGIDIFIGTVRNATKGKSVMAETEKIAQQAGEKWPVQKLLIHHRVGFLQVGEVPVLIAVSAAHRDDAFEACHYVIDTLKQTVPIWKKEIFEDGEVWVAAHP
jgi:molybdopterin synthase catalytic subunit